jgi:hypothetical protein
VKIFVVIAAMPRFPMKKSMVEVFAITRSEQQIVYSFRQLEVESVDYARYYA